MEIKSSKKPRLTNSFFNLNLTSRLEKWPIVNFQYNRTREQDDQDEHQIDSLSNTVLTGFNYEYKFIKMMYNYMGLFSTDYVTNTDQNNTNHITRLSIQKSFFHNRVSLYSDGGYNYYKNTTTVPEAQTVEQKKRAANGYYGIDSTPSQSDSTTFTSSSALIDGNTQTTVLTTQEYINIGLTLFSVESVDTIYIYTEKNYTYSPSAPTKEITWAVYSTNEETEPRTWTLVTSSASFSYDDLEHRFKLRFRPTQARCFKVVYYPGINAQSFGVTEIEAYGATLVEEKTESISKTYTANMGISVQPLEKWTTDYHLSYYKTDTSATTSPSSSNYTLSQGVSVVGEIRSNLLLTLSYQTTTNKIVEKNQSDIYSASFRYTPLETLTSTLTMSHSTIKVEKEEVSKSNVFNLNNVAQIWEGVDVNWDLNLTLTDNLKTDTTSQSIYSSLYVRATLTEHISWDFGYNQSWQKTKGKESSTSTYADLNTTLVYTPSSRLYGRIFLQYTNSEENVTFSHQYTLGYFLTRNIQMNLSSQFMNSNTSDQMVHSVDLNWNIWRKASFRIGYSYSVSENDVKQTTHSFYSRFSSSF
ncbi:MAG: hypothetical protein LWW94_04930 [Candidatus Desulfofervidaceae bacterium]|nr:hypothetical protein [Candidatus Desulfofervidaceae bacterium]